MAVVKIMAKASTVKTLEILKKKLERDYGASFSEGPFEDKGYFKMFFTIEVSDNDK